MFDHGCVCVNGVPRGEPGLPVIAGDVVEVRFDPHTRYHERPAPRETRAFRLIHEDAHLIVVEKAAAVLTVPTDRGETNTLLDAVKVYLKHRQGHVQPAVVQRLDRGVSGVLVLAKNAAVGRLLQEQFRRHSAQREYLACVGGVMSLDSGVFESRLATGKDLQRFSTADPDEGEHAVTHFRVERRLAQATFVRVWLETGRRNQIRVHFAEAGHPVLGDPRYRPELAQHPEWLARRLALHAAVLGFEHPVTGEKLRFESPLPQEFERFLHRAVRG